MAELLTRAQQQQVTRRRLLDAALGVFRQRGFAAATIDEISNLAGFTRGAFYAHFGSKEAAFIAVLEEHAPAQIEAFRARVAAANSVRDKLAEIVGVTVPAPDHAARELLGTLELAARVVDNPELHERVVRLQLQVEGVLGWCAADVSRRRRRVLSVPEARAGVMVWSLLTGSGQRLLIEPGAPVRDDATTAVDALITGLSDPR